MKEEIRKELESLDSTLANQNHKSDFEVPDDYFEKMQDDVIGKMNIPVPNKSIFIQYRKWIYASAAVIILVVAAMFVFDTQSGTENGFETLENEAIYAYLDENLDGISLQMLVSEESISMSFLNDPGEQEQIEEYLEQNLDDLDMEILEELL